MRDTLQLMTIERAQVIVKEIIAARMRWGKGVKIPYTIDQVFDALIVLDKAGNFDGGTKAEMTKLRRQLAACQNREKRYSGKSINDLQAEAESANENTSGNE